MMIRGLTPALLISMLLAVSGCNNSATPDAATTPDPNDNPNNNTNGNVQATGQVELSTLNFESEAKFIGPRVHMIVGEVYRHLFYIHQAVDVDARMDLASDVPKDDIITDEDNIITLDGTFNVDPETCANNAGINTVFQDNDSSDDLSNGNVILRDTDNFTCEYAFLTGGGPAGLRWLPKDITGSIRYDFTGGDPAAGTYTGTATFGGPEYRVTDGLLQASVDSVTETFTGTVDFDINYATGNATFSDINVEILGGSTSLTGPNIIRIDSIVRTLDNAGPDSVSINNGEIVSTISTQSINFRTIAFNNNGVDELSAPDEGLPNLGAILFEGDGTAAHARTRLAVVVA